MKCAEFKQLLERANDFRLKVELGSADIFRLLDSSPTKSIAQLSTSIAAVRINEQGSSNDASEFLNFLGSLYRLLKGYAKPPVLKDLELLISALEPHRRAGLAAVELELTKLSTSKKTGSKQAPPSIRDDVVVKFCRKLEEALGDDAGFSAVFATLDNGEVVTTKELVAIAKRFSSSNSAGRAAALKKIYARHQAIMVSRAKSAATAGRIAG